MEMLRESKAREKEDGVDPNAFIVDRNQFFNTQIGVGYQHKKVIRQRTVGSAGVGQRVVDMSAAPTPPTSERRKRRPSHSKNGHREVDSNVDGAEKDKPKKSRKSANKKSKSKKRKKEKEENSGKAKKRVKKDKAIIRREKKDGHRASRKVSKRRRDRHSKEKDSDSSGDHEPKRSKKHKGGGGEEQRDSDRSKEAKIFGNSARAKGHEDSFSSSSDSSSDSAEESDGSRKISAGTVNSSSMPPPPPSTGVKYEPYPPEVQLERARVPLQRLRDLIEGKIRSKATRSKAGDGDGDNDGNSELRVVSS